MAGGAWAQAPSGGLNTKPLIDTFVAHSGLPRGWVVSVKPDIVVAIKDRDGLATRTVGDRVRLQGEVTSDEAAGRLGYRSMRSLVEVNCETRRDRVVEMEVFADHNLKGASLKRTLPGGWVQPSEDAYMADVVRTVCRAAPRRDELEQAPPKAPEAGAGGSRALDPRVPEPKPADLRSELKPATLKPPISASATAKPAPPRPAPVTPPNAAPAPASKPAARPAGVSVQVGALDSMADAQRALGALAGLISTPQGSTIQTAKVGDRTFYRAIVGGFTSRAEANAFCAKVTAKGGSCFIR